MGLASAAASSATDGVYVALSIGMELTPHLGRFLDRPLLFRPRRLPPDTAAIVGWGLKGKSLEAVAFARQHGLPYVALEDGFLRSVELGNVDGPLSVVVDDEGIYYDARQPSRLEGLIAGGACDVAEHERAAALRQRWLAGRVSKYNHARETPPPVAGPYVLAVDQTAGDASIEYGLASAASFARMLDAALDEHPALPVVMKVHPDVIAGRKLAHFKRLTAGQASRVTLFAAASHAPSLLAPAEAVYVVTSQMGFEALLWEKPVRCFGMPFYAGWGLTQDELPRPLRRQTQGDGDASPITLDRLVHAALIDYPHYLDPETLARCAPERLLAWMSLQRRMRERYPPHLQAIGFSNWKKPVARAFFAASTLDFILPQDSKGSTGDKAWASPMPKAVWGRPAEADAALVPAGTPLLRVEDGFLRSVGLGVDWVRPLSWVIDQSGMYYDATAASDLETLLQNADFDDALRARAKALRECIVATGITKYNVGSGSWHRPAAARRVLLAVGQVESDASIAFGSVGSMRSNLDLVRAARAASPDAHLVYKAHPDVLAGKRARGEDEDQVAANCDEVVGNLPMTTLLGAVDEVHVLTSLAGFEALLRGRPVVCHGLPFYAGWGLTEDRAAHPSRTRRLTLNELVAAALILYPTYVSQVTGRYTTPERALYELLHWTEQRTPKPGLRLRLLRRLKQWRDRVRCR